MTEVRVQRGLRPTDRDAVVSFLREVDSLDGDTLDDNLQSDLQSGPADGDPSLHVPFVAATAFALAALVKATAAVPLLLLLVAIAAAAGRGRRVRALAAPVGAASALLIAFAAPFLSRSDPTLGLAELATHEGWLAPSRFLRRILDVVGLGASARVAFALVLVVAVATLARAVWRSASDGVDDVGAAVAWGLLAMLLLAPVLLPWYAAWLLPVVWFLPRRATIAALGTSVALAVSLFATEPSRAGSAFDLNLLVGHWVITPAVVVLLVVATRDHFVELAPRAG